MKPSSVRALTQIEVDTLLLALDVLVASDAKTVDPFLALVAGVLNDDDIARLHDELAAAAVVTISGVEP